MIKLKTWGKSTPDPYLKENPDIGGMEETQSSKPEFDDEFLIESMQNNTKVLMYLINGVKLKGKILAFNNRSIKFTYIDRNINTSCTQIVSRQAIASIMYHEDWNGNYDDGE